MFTLWDYLTRLPKKQKKREQSAKFASALLIVSVYLFGRERDIVVLTGPRDYPVSHGIPRNFHNGKNPEETPGKNEIKCEARRVCASRRTAARACSDVVLRLPKCPYCMSEASFVRDQPLTMPSIRSTIFMFLLLLVGPPYLGLFSPVAVRR